MKVIFLDVDGVLNWIGTADRYCGYIGLCPDRIARFNRIIEAHPDAKIVVSSTWRKGFAREGGFVGLDGFKKLVAERGLKGDIIGATAVRFSSNARGNEIREWIEDWREEHPGEELNFVILDDDTSAMQGWSWEEYIGPDANGDDMYHTRVSEDLRPRHVRTFWDGEMRVNKSDPNGVSIDVEGGLQDEHIQRAIDVLNGKLIEVKP